MSKDRDRARKGKNDVPTDPQAAIRERFANQLYGQIVDINRNNRNSESLWALTNQIRHDYTGRFAHELIQNADDAAHRGGQIRLEVTEEAVVVANDGDVFSHRDFKSICGLALSDKDIQKNIGNKGLGFRSVLEITSAPYIYSRRAADDSRPGYCFVLTDTTRGLVQRLLDTHRRGNRMEDLLHTEFGGDVSVFYDDDPNSTRLRRALVDRPDLVSEVPRRLQTYQFPRPTPEPGDAVRRLWDAGFTNVFVLPLDQTDAARKAHEALESITPEILLFLRSLERIEVVTSKSSWSAYRTGRRRTKDRVLEQATIDSTGRHEGKRRFWLWRNTVKGHAVRDCLDELPETWEALEKGARITLAIERSASRHQTALFSVGLPTQLKTGSDLWIDAPFFPDISRKGIVLDKKISKLLLKRAAAEVPWFLRGLAAREERQATVDAMRAIEFSPGEHILEPLLTGPTSTARSIRRIPLVFPHSQCRRETLIPLADLRLPPGVQGLTTVVAGNLAPHIPVADPWYDRHDGLVPKVALAFDARGEPGPEEIPRLVAQIGSALHAGTSGDDRAAAFRRLYADLESITRAGAEPIDFTGQRIVLDHTGRLLQVASDRPVVFERPRATRGEQEGEVLLRTLPRVLEDRVTFLHPKATERTRERGPAARFVREYHLSSGFQTGEIVNRALSRAFKDARTSSRAKANLLNWAFELDRAMTRSAGDDRVAWGQVHVPTNRGWRPAERTYTSEGWCGSDGVLVRKALAERDFAGKPRNFLVSPAEIEKRLERDTFDHHEWESFLHEVLGVARHPRIVPMARNKKRPVIEGRGCRLQPRGGRLTQPTWMSAGGWQRFVEALETKQFETLIQSPRRYRLDHLRTLDGLAQLDGEKAPAFLRLLARYRDGWVHALRSRVQRYDYPDSSYYGTDIGSSLHAELVTRAWVPTSRPGTALEIARIEDAVFVPDVTGKRAGQMVSAPEILPHVAPDLVNAPGVRELLEDLGMACWDDLRLDQATRWLAWLQRKVTPEPGARYSAVRGLWLELVSRAARGWSPESELPVNSDDWTQILADVPTKGRSVETRLWTPSPNTQDGDGVLYVPRRASRRSQLVGIVPVAVADANTIEFLQAQFGPEAIRPLTELALDPTCAPDLELDDLPLLREQAPWLMDAVLATLAYGRREKMNTEGDRFKGHRDRLLPLRIALVSDLQLAVRGLKGAPVSMSAFVWEDHSVLLVDRDRGDAIGELAEALGNHLSVQDLAAHVGHALRDLRECGLTNPPQPDDVEEALLANVLDSSRLKYVRASWRSSLSLLAERVLPALAHFAHGKQLGSLQTALKEAFDHELPERSLREAWATAVPGRAFPKEVQAVLDQATRGADPIMVARTAWETLGIDIDTWNRYSRDLGLDVPPIVNREAEKRVGQVRDALFAHGLDAVRRKLRREGREHTYLARKARVEAVRILPSTAVLYSWDPPISALARPFLEALTSRRPLPTWVRALQPRAGEAIATLVARLDATFGGPDPEADDAQARENLEHARESV